MGKGKKKGWKKLPREADESIHDVNIKRQISKLPDDEMFFVDTTPLPNADENPPSLTFKQKAALNHKLYKSILKDDDDLDMKDDDIKTFPKYELPSEIKKTKQNNASMYDLWDEDKIDSILGVETVKHHKTLKRKRREATRFVPNILPAVEIPSEGASYNPSLNSYVAYANKIATEELKMEKDEKRVSNNAPAKNVDFDVGTKFEDFRELLSRDPIDSGDDESLVSADAPTKPSQSQPKSKTIKQKKQAHLSKINSLQKVKESMSKKHLQDLNNLKKVRNEVNKVIEEHQTKIAFRKQKKVLDSLTKRKKLGRGKFKAYEEPILLTDELNGSLRQLPSRGNILEERFKSLQKRNILPIAGERQKSNRKVSLKVKFVEKRSVKEVKRGSRVI